MRKKVDSQDQDVGQATYIDIPVSGALDRESLVEVGVKDVDSPGFSGYAKELSFMEEMVTVMMHESTDENASPIEDVYCNGVPQRFIRGMEQTVKRKYLQILCDMKQTAIRTQTGVQGDMVVNRVNKHSALRFPFSVVSDPNRNGAAWLKAQLAKV